jgi:hypothetical protein
MESHQQLDILSQLPISEEEMEILAENGFDDLESFRFLSLNTLHSLGISDPEQVFKYVQAICEQF